MPIPPKIVVDHADDNWIMFKGLTTDEKGTAHYADFTPSEDAFFDEFSSYWLSFVRSYNPNTYKLPRSPEWPTYTANNRTRVVLSEGTVNESGSTVEQEEMSQTVRCAWLGSKYKLLEN